jgi:hypothetical protein
VRAEDGTLLTPPEDWQLLAPGDAMITRRVKAGGPHWVVKEKKGRKLFSRGIWAPTKRIEAAQRYAERMRASPTYQRKLDAGRARRAEGQRVYVQDFQRAVHAFLRFPAQYAALAEQMALAIATHATPVGSGTVARTQRIPLVERAEAAVIAWMRHQTTAYDDMVVPRVKGMRRDIRRKLAARSHTLLGRYRRGEVVDPATCPLARALASSAS